MLNLAEKREFVNTWGSWLSTWPWEWFGTFTFRDDYRVHSAMKALKNFAVKEISPNVFAFIAIEMHHHRDAAHGHALMGNVGGLDPYLIHEAWFRKYGRNQVFPYDPKQGAVFYLTKYVTKGISDYQLLNMKQVTFTLS